MLKQNPSSVNIEMKEQIIGKTELSQITENEAESKKINVRHKMLLLRVFCNRNKRAVSHLLIFTRIFHEFSFMIYLHLCKIIYYRYININ